MTIAHKDQRIVNAKKLRAATQAITFLGGMLLNMADGSLDAALKAVYSPIAMASAAQSGRRDPELPNAH